MEQRVSAQKGPIRGRLGVELRARTPRGQVPALGRDHVSPESVWDRLEVGQGNALAALRARIRFGFGARILLRAAPTEAVDEEEFSPCTVFGLVDWKGKCCKFECVLVESGLEVA